MVFYAAHIAIFLSTSCALYIDFIIIVYFSFYVSYSYASFFIVSGSSDYCTTCDFIIWIIERSDGPSLTYDSDVTSAFKNPIQIKKIPQVLAGGP